MRDKVLMTTGFNFEGFHIDKYLGVFSGECALGTGFFSSLESDISDLFGENSKLYTNKLRRAKGDALEQLQDQTVRAGGNAVIGLSINYTMFTRDIIGISVYGTAVKISAIIRKKIEDKVIPILKYNKNTAFRPICLHGHSVRNQYAVSMEVFYDSEEAISGILADVKFITVFDTVYELKDVAFAEFSFTNRNHLVSNYTVLSIPCENIVLLKNVIIITKKYVKNDELIDISDIDLEQELVDQEYQYENKPSLDELEKLNTMKEIYEYLKDYMEKYNQSEPELMEWLEKSTKIERLYGNRKEEAMEYIKGYYKVD